MTTSPPGFDKAAAVATLQRFNEKADRLREGRFAKRVFGEPSGVNIQAKEGGPVTAKRTGPDADAIEAAVLTFRFFIQDNEPTSLRNLATLYPTLPVSAYLSANCVDARTKLNAWLDGPLGIGITYNGKSYSRREVFETFIYGDLAHANKEKEAQFKAWAAHPILFPLFENEFVVTLAQTMDVLWYIQILNRDALKELGVTN